MMLRRRGRATVVSVLSAVLLIAMSGCGWRGLNGLPLPGTGGRGSGSYLVQAQLPDLDNLTQNSRVRVGDVTVGSVAKIELQGWHALVTLRIDGDVVLPANVTAKVGQTSLLGTQHIELTPPRNEAPQGKLNAGGVIPLSRGSIYPTTEQTLATMSLLLNGGGLGQLQDIQKAFSTAGAGREDQLRSLWHQVDVFTSNIEDQTSDIIAATESLNNLSGQFADQDPVLQRALQTIPDGLAILSDQRVSLTQTLDQLGKFSALAGDSLDRTKRAITNELTQFAAVLKALADAGPALTRAGSILFTFPFPIEAIPKTIRGDYGNATIIVDLTLSRLDAGLLTGTRFEGSLTRLEMQWGRTIGQVPSPYTGGNPILAPYRFDQGR